MIEELTHILTDPAHLVAELVLEVASYLLIAPAVAWAVRRHDRKHHS